MDEIPERVVSDIVTAASRRVKTRPTGEALNLAAPREGGKAECMKKVGCGDSQPTLLTFWSAGAVSLNVVPVHTNCLALKP